MRKTLIIALGLASLGAIATVQQASAEPCVDLALTLCHAQGSDCTTGPQYLTIFHQCQKDPYAAKQAVQELKRQAGAASANLTASARNTVSGGSGPQNLYPSQGGPGPKKGAVPPGSSSGSRSRNAQ